MIVNMLVSLDNLSPDSDAEKTLVAAAQISLVNKQGAGAAERAWIKSAFGGKWPEEAAAGWNWFAVDAKGRPVGFATYEQRDIRWWWLEHWRDQPDVGFFGPTGVSWRMRRKGLGCVLTRRALASLKSLGYRRAIIPAVGPVRFYERCCGAAVVERLKMKSRA